MLLQRLPGGLKELASGTSLEAHWLGLQASTAGAVGLIPGQGTKAPYAVEHGQKIVLTRKELACE